MSKLTGSNSGSSLRSLQGVNNSGAANININAVRDYYRFQKLYNNVLYGLNNYLNDFNNGQFNTLSDKALTDLLLNITNNKLYNNSSITNLEDFIYDPTIFNKYKNATLNIVTGFKQANAQKLIIDDLNSTVETLTLKASILDNNQLIEQYISKKQLDVLVFDINTIYDTEIVLQDWYARYLFIHGAPANGVFDIQKLSDIVDTLISEGVITLQQFINDSS